MYKHNATGVGKELCPKTLPFRNIRISNHPTPNAAYFFDFFPLLDGNQGKYKGRFYQRFYQTATQFSGRDTLDTSWQFSASSKHPINFKGNNKTTEMAYSVHVVFASFGVPDFIISGISNLNITLGAKKGFSLHNVHFCKSEQVF